MCPGASPQGKIFKNKLEDGGILIPSSPPKPLKKGLPKSNQSSAQLKYSLTTNLTLLMKTLQTWSWYESHKCETYPHNNQIMKRHTINNLEMTEQIGSKSIHHDSLQFTSTNIIECDICSIMVTWGTFIFRTIYWTDQAFFKALHFDPLMSSLSLQKVVRRRRDSRQRNGA